MILSDRYVLKIPVVFILILIFYVFIHLYPSPCLSLAEKPDTGRTLEAEFMQEESSPEGKEVEPPDIKSDLVEEKSDLLETTESSINPNQPPEKPCVQSKPSKPLGFYDYRFYKSFGGFGQGNGYFELPVDIAIDSDDNIYVCDLEGGRIQTFDSEGSFDEEWDRLSIDLSAFNESNTMDEPQSLYVDYKDRVDKTFIYVADTKNNRILQFNEDGMLINPEWVEIDESTIWSTMIVSGLLWGKFGSGNGQFHHPTDIAVDKHDNCYILDSRNYRIQCFDDTGKFKFEWGGFGSGPRSFLKPTRLAYDPSRFGAIWVIDSKDGRLHKFDLDGDFIKAYVPKDKDQHPLPNPADFCFDTQGFIYLTDSTLNRVFKYNNDVEYIQCWGEEGSGSGQFKKPMGIAVDSEDRVLVVDSGNFRIQIFRQF